MVLGSLQQEDITQGVGVEWSVEWEVPSLQSRGLEDSWDSYGPCRRCLPSLLPHPVAWACSSSMDSSARNSLAPWAGCCWSCYIRALCLQSSGAGAGLNLVIPLLRRSQDLKGSARSRSLLMGKMCPRNGKSSLPGCGKVSHLFIWRELIVPLLLQIWQELWCSWPQGRGLVAFTRRGAGWVHSKPGAEKSTFCVPEKSSFLFAALGNFQWNQQEQENLGRLLAHETWTCLEKPRQEGKYKVLMTLLTLQCAKHGVSVWRPNWQKQFPLWPWQNSLLSKVAALKPENTS